MSASTEARKRGSVTRNRLLLTLLMIAAVVGLTALSLHLSGSLTLDNLLVELGLKAPDTVTISTGRI